MLGVDSLPLCLTDPLLLAMQVVALLLWLAYVAVLEVWVVTLPP
jgi:hypothetical protein